MIPRQERESYKTIYLGNPEAAHAYEIEVVDGPKITVHANNRDAARIIAMRAGYDPLSVNMVG